MAKLERLDLTLVRVPLMRPYELAFGPLEAFDTIVVEATLDDGRTGLGEATITLSGYTNEVLGECWDFAREFADRFAGADTTATRAALVPHCVRFPFTTTAFGTAIEMALGSPLLAVETPARVPILGLLQGADEAALARDMDRLIEAGFQTLKFKVGRDVENDLRRVATVQALLDGRATIRLDANRGFTREEGCRFASSLDPTGIELFEQPCAADDWEAAWAVAGVARVPMMLDESIYGLDDIVRAAELGIVAYVKVKLMKFGGLAHLATALELIRSRGLGAVLGNGVAHDTACWMEACVARGRLANAGEMNGFLKPETAYVREPLRFERGAIVLEPGYRPELDPVIAARVTQAKHSAGASLAASRR
ncbi:MAG: mandelate racemase/muconate lactonizing enzyme family protein [Candidatus Eremiobacteraeota bacterium]|nr:mandelate racemase/muconate lactonizing enzyme family protein [Candidatus Eremiobacteraeota bacterium]